MRLTIDNLDGLGAIDYSDQLMAEGPLTIERRLNKPATCTWSMRDEPVRPARLGRGRPRPGLVLHVLARGPRRR